MEYPVCGIGKQTEAAKVLKNCDLIVWDEGTMSPKDAFEALDRTMRDLRGVDLPIGGVTLVISGDFRQTLPVVPRGTPADEMKASIKSSYLWTFVQTIHLTTNMRVKLYGDFDAGNFAQLLLKLGNGEIPNTNDVISIPDDCGTIVSSMVPGEQHSHKSIDTTLDTEQAVHYPTEFLNSLELPGLPPYNLSLKVGCPIMLLRNLDAPKLCNGTKLIVKRLLPHVIEATIMTGCAKGEDVFIPRIPLIPSNSTIEFKRLQFPVCLCFAMSINKAQGQSLKVAGLELSTPCFSHGQLYVGCSRVGSSEALYILAPEGKTSNIVYPRALH